MQNDLTNELGQNFIEYAVAVNTDRAIPDAKSGLKPVAKRILWTAFEEGRSSSKPHVKSASIVGDVMGHYHPHGDSSIYGAMVRLSQPWVMRYPLIDWHGNNGNIAGDPPASYRYTEARLAKISEAGLLAGIKKKNVDFIPNYDETLEEPVTLPSVFPNLLCNPNTGIGVAMACNWAPHNLSEVAAAIFSYLNGEKPSLPGPDFPTGGLIINKDDIPKIMETGHGSVKVRARYNVEGNKIIFYEIPYGTTIEGLISEVGQACDDKEIEGIVDIHDESSRKIKIVVECGKGINPNIIATKLYAKTNFQISFSYNQVALIDKTPVELSLTDAIKIYVNHNLDCIKRESEFDLEKAKARLEIVNGLLRALASIDDIINLIKKSASAAAAKVNLMTRYEFTENQAKSILAMRLSSLANLEQVELENEQAELNNTIDKLQGILTDQNKQIEILKNNLSELVKKFSDNRRTELAQIEVTPEEKKTVEIIPEEVVFVISKNGDIKRVPKDNFKIQHRKGVGVKTLDTAILVAQRANTLDTLMIFTSTGKMYRLGVDKIPEGTNSSKGTNLKSILPFETGEEVQTAAIASQYKVANHIIFFTKNGLIKKTKFEEYANTKKTTGIQAIKLKENDKLISTRFIDNESVMLVTKNGNIIHVPTDDIKPTGRLTSGVKGIGLKDGDEVVTALQQYSFVKDAKVLITTTTGKAKRMTTNNFIIQNRGGRGVNCIKLDSGDYVAAAAMVKDTDSILIIGNPNSICIPVSEVSEQSRNGSGTKVIERSLISDIMIL